MYLKSKARKECHKKEKKRRILYRWDTGSTKRFKELAKTEYEKKEIQEAWKELKDKVLG